MYEKNRAWIELNREHLLRNIKELQHLAGERCELMPAAGSEGRCIRPWRRPHLIHAAGRRHP